MFDGKVGSLNKRKVSLRGKSGREGSAKDAIDKARKERAFRAVERKHNDSAIHLQSWYRGRSIASRERGQCRNDLVSKLHDLQRVEAAMALARGDTESIVVPLSILTSLVRQTVFVFEASIDAATVSVVCKRLLQAPTALRNVRDAAGLTRIRRISTGSSKRSLHRQLCISADDPVCLSVLQGLSNEGVVIRSGPPSFRLVQPSLLKYIATLNHLSFRSFSVLCDCALALIRELGDGKNIATQVSQILLPAEGLMKPRSQLYTKLILKMVNQPWAKCAWASALSSIDSTFVSKVGLTAGTGALVNILKLHQTFRTEPSNNYEWTHIVHLLQPEILVLLTKNEKLQDMSNDGEIHDSTTSDSEFSELEEEETLELRHIIRQKLLRTTSTISSLSNQVHALAVEALHILTNPIEALQWLDVLPPVSFAPGSMQKKTLDYSVHGSPETPFLDDALSVCAVYGELVAWGYLHICRISNKRFEPQQSLQHSSPEGGWHRSVRHTISILAYGTSENSLVARLWWHLKNRWRVELVISEGFKSAETSSEEKKGHGSLNINMPLTESENVAPSHFSQLLNALLLFCATYHLQLVSLDDQVCCVIEFLRDWLLKACWISPLLESDQPPSRVQLRLFESAVGLYNALHERWSRRPYAKPEIWNWQNLNSAPLFPEQVAQILETRDGSHQSLHKIESYFFGGSKPLPIILVNIPQVFHFKHRLSIFRALTLADASPRRSVADPIAQYYFPQPRRRRHRNEAPGRQFESFFGIPNAPSGSGAILSDSERADEFSDDEPPQFQSTFHSPNFLRVRRSELYKDSLEGLADANMHGNVRIQFVNEHGVDEPGIDGGGVFQEWLISLIKCAFNTEHGLWVETSERVEPLFSFPFLNSLLDRQNYIDELYTFDASLYRSLMELKSYAATNGNDVKDLYLTFSVDRPVQEEEDNGSQEEKRGAAPHNRMHSVNLLPGGEKMEVTNKNVSLYIRCMGHFILNVECRYQCKAFISGFREELQRLIGGDSLTSLDVKDWMENTTYASGYHPSQPYIQAFWDFVQHMDLHDQSALLQFVTSCSRQPLMGFKELYPRFCIQQVHVHDDWAGRGVKLPMSSTCMNLLKLPKYNDVETMRTKLLYAIHSGGGFELT